MNGEDNGGKIKKVIVFSLVSILVIAFLTVVLVLFNKSKAEKARKEKEEKIAKLKTDVFLSDFFKKNWSNYFESGCLQKKEFLRPEKFSWLDEDGNPQLMEGHLLQLSFKGKTNSSCCGSVSKLGVEITNYFNSQGFVENETNKNIENNIYAFENLDFKCVYGYGKVENKEKFCNFSIVCGRVNNYLTNSDFSKIYEMYNPEKKSDRMIIVDKFMDIPEGNFAKGRIILGFYFDSPKKFIVSKSVKEEWYGLGDPFGTQRIDSCWNLLNNNCPPAVAGNKCYDTEKKKFVRYDVLYEKRNK